MLPTHSRQWIMLVSTPLFFVGIGLFPPIVAHHDLRHMCGGSVLWQQSCVMYANSANIKGGATRMRKEIRTFHGLFWQMLRRILCCVMSNQNVSLG